MRALVFSLLAGSLAFAAPPLPLEVNAFASRAGDRIRLTAVAQLVTPGATLTSASISLTGPDGRSAGQWTAKTADLRGPVLVATFDVAPGTYVVQAAVTGPSGAKGAAEAKVVAGLTRAAGTLTLGNVVMGIDDGAFSPRLHFSDAPSASATFELYGGSTGMKVVVEMDVAATPDGPAIATLRPTITATPEPDRFIVSAPVDLAALSPGAYVVRAVVGLDGQPATSIVGSFRVDR